jgi:hypothetical protein
MIDDPLPDLDLPEAVGVLKEDITREEAKEISSCANTKGQKPACRALAVYAAGKRSRDHFRACMAGLGDVYGEPAHWIMPVINSGKSAMPTA